MRARDPLPMFAYFRGGWDAGRWEDGARDRVATVSSLASLCRQHAMAKSWAGWLREWMTRCGAGMEGNNMSEGGHSFLFLFLFLGSLLRVPRLPAGLGRAGLFFLDEFQRETRTYLYVGWAVVSLVVGREVFFLLFPFFGWVGGPRGPFVSFFRLFRAWPRGATPLQEAEQLFPGAGYDLPCCSGVVFGQTYLSGRVMFSFFGYLPFVLGCSSPWELTCCGCPVLRVYLT